MKVDLKNIHMDVVPIPDRDKQFRGKWATIKTALSKLGPGQSLRVPRGTLFSGPSVLRLPKYLGKIRTLTLDDGQYIWFEKNGAAK
jgi:hypothetical protein